MQCVRCPAILALAALVLCGPSVSSQLDRDQDQSQDLDLQLRQHRLLQRARSAGLLSEVRAAAASHGVLSFELLNFSRSKSLTCVEDLVDVLGWMSGGQSDKTDKMPENTTFTVLIQWQE